MYEITDVAVSNLNSVWEDLNEQHDDLTDHETLMMEEADNNDANNSFLDTVWEHIKQQFPHHGLADHIGKKTIQNILEQQPENGDALELAHFVMDAVRSVGLNIVEEDPAESNEASYSFPDTVWEHIKQQFPHHGLADHRGKFKKIIQNILKEQPENGDASEIAYFAIEAVLAVGLNNIEEDAASPMELQEFPLPAPEQGKFHDFEISGNEHFYVATSQFFKMLLQSPRTRNAKPILNLSLIHI